MPEPIQTTSPMPTASSAPSPTSGDDTHAPGATAPRPSLSVVIATPPLSELALGCISKVNGAILPFLALAPNPLVATLVGIKAGSELRECVDQRIADASLRAGLRECLDNGGTPLGVIENVVTCQVGTP